MNTTATRDRDNKLTIETTIALTGNKELRIATSKQVFKKGIACRATVVTPHADGKGYSFKMPGDYMTTMKADPTARATEKTLRGLHDFCLAYLVPLMADIEAFYAMNGETVKEAA